MNSVLCFCDKSIGSSIAGPLFFILNGFFLSCLNFLGEKTEVWYSTSVIWDIRNCFLINWNRFLIWWILSCPQRKDLEHSWNYFTRLVSRGRVLIVHSRVVELARHWRFIALSICRPTAIGRRCFMHNDWLRFFDWLVVWWASDPNHYEWITMDSIFVVKWIIMDSICCIVGSRWVRGQWYSSVFVSQKKGEFVVDVTSLSWDDSGPVDTINEIVL